MGKKGNSHGKSGNNVKEYVIRWYATSKHRLVEPGLSPALIRTAMIRNLTGPVIYFLAIAISYLPLNIFGLNSVQLCLALYGLMPIVYILPSRIDTYWKRGSAAH